jgi:hypothetical protein
MRYEHWSFKQLRAKLSELGRASHHTASHVEKIPRWREVQVDLGVVVKCRKGVIDICHMLPKLGRIGSDVTLQPGIDRHTDTGVLKSSSHDDRRSWFGYLQFVESVFPSRWSRQRVFENVPVDTCTDRSLVAAVDVKVGMPAIGLPGVCCPGRGFGRGGGPRGAASGTATNSPSGLRVSTLRASRSATNWLHLSFLLAKNLRGAAVKLQQVRHVDGSSNISDLVTNSAVAG